MQSIGMSHENQSSQHCDDPDRKKKKKGRMLRPFNTFKWRFFSHSLIWHCGRSEDLHQSFCKIQGFELWSQGSIHAKISIDVCHFLKEYLHFKPFPFLIQSFRERLKFRLRSLTLLHPHTHFAQVCHHHHPKMTQTCRFAQKLYSTPYTIIPETTRKQLPTTLLTSHYINTF